MIIFSQTRSQKGKNQQHIEQVLAAATRTMIPVGILMRYVIRSYEEAPVWHNMVVSNGHYRQSLLLR